MPVTQGHQIAIAVLAFAVPLQTIACVYGFLCRDEVASTGMGVLAGTWATFAVIVLTFPPGMTNRLGILLVVAAGALLIPAVAALVSKTVA